MSCNLDLHQVCSWCKQPGTLTSRIEKVGHQNHHVALCENCLPIHDQDKKARRKVREDNRQHRYHTDEEYRAEQRKRNNERQRKKYSEDPVFRAATIARVIACQQKKREKSSVGVQNTAERLPVQGTDTDTDTEFCISISSLSPPIQKTYRTISREEVDALVNQYFHSNKPLGASS